ISTFAFPSGTAAVYLPFSILAPTVRALPSTGKKPIRPFFTGSPLIETLPATTGSLLLLHPTISERQTSKPQVEIWFIEARFAAVRAVRRVPEDRRRSCCRARATYSPRCNPKQNARIHRKTTRPRLPRGDFWQPSIDHRLHPQRRA